MTNNFKSRIKSYREPLFYNSRGSTDAYKLCVRHLSCAMSAGFAKLSNGYMIPNDVLHLVDLENEKILIISDEIKLIELEILK
ncbi:MAG: Unknown protein [uncultured Sulfurovum sp.]|uniref:Uncharacterized protein n=1 Tax=uncultured Sulfurovum sp. TaxID=269237 RepID=A0A6S6TIL7_9BACT|nr:MAG: Unknown protein [uncultured Sulfurovum sp.]